MWLGWKFPYHVSVLRTAKRNFKQQNGLSVAIFFANLVILKKVLKMLKTKVVRGFWIKTLHPQDYVSL